MKARAIRVLSCVTIAILLAPQDGFSQGTAAPQAGAQQTNAQQAPLFKPEELDQILAQIALYPDDLLAQVLMASTYPLEIVQADRWVRDPNNAKLKGDQLAAALQNQTWDPSVKSLVPFPQVLQMMSEQLEWTQRLGDAVLAQEADVMASIQRLRKKAQEADMLKSTEQQVVTTDAASQAVVIQPANPSVVYVPAYSPTVVYGGWPYPAYPPYYYPPPAYYYPGSAFLSGIAFAAGIAVIGSMWGWGDCNWGHNDINVNVNKYNNINRNNINTGRATQLPANSGSWRHDPSHRGGVAYRDAGTRQKYLGAKATPSASARDFRGYGGTQGQAGLGQRNAGQLPSNLGGQGTGSLGQRAGGQTPGQGFGGQGGIAQGGIGQGQRATAGQLPSGAGGGFQGGQGQQAGAFNGFGSNRSTVHTQSTRGQMSRQAPIRRTGGRR